MNADRIRDGCGTKLIDTMMQTKTVYTNGVPNILIKKCEENKNPGIAGVCYQKDLDYFFKAAAMVLPISAGLATT